ncbi:MAG: tetratricopeptide repeat protein [Gammaproteobacteria bacterium]|nr:tetratricopeptide repeat protein [Gammaproteobacteria bacterium]
MASSIQELRVRNLFKKSVAYALIAGLILQTCAVVAPANAEARTNQEDILAKSHALEGETRTERGRYAEAEQAFKTSIQLNPNNSNSRHLYSKLLYRLGRLEEALVQIQKAAEIDPLDPLLQTTVGEIFLSLGRPEEALPLYDRAVEIAPDRSPGYQMRADYYWGIGKLDKALQGYRKAWTLDPSNLIIIPGFAHMYSQLGDQSQAFCWARRGIKAGPEQFYTNYVIALVHFYAGNAEQAMEHFRSSLKDNATLNPLSLSITILRDHKLQRGHFNEALTLYKEYYPALFGNELPEITLGNNFAAIGIAFVYQQLGKQEQANKLLEASLKYVANVPRQGWSGNVIADVLIHTLRGDKQQALTALREAIDAGWRNQWGYELDFDLILEPLRNETKFQAMRDEIKTDLAEQLVRVKALEKEADICVTE